MKIFLDTADLDQIRRAADANLIDGITTNPSLMMQAAGQRDPSDIFLEICKTVDGPVSAEVIAIEKDNMLAEGRRLAKIHDIRLRDRAIRPIHLFPNHLARH